MTIKKYIALLLVCCAPVLPNALRAAELLKITDPPTSEDVIGYLPPEVATVDPPVIGWMPEPAAGNNPTWDLQVTKADDTFSKSVIAISTPWLIYTHTKALGAGKYQWRYRFRTADGKISEWSKTRNFEIPANTPEFSRPETEEVAKNIPEAHPHAFIRPENLQALRDSMKTMPDEWAKMKKVADTAMKMPLMDEPQPWEGGKWNNEQWLKYYRQITYSSNAMSNLAFAYLVSQDKKYGERAKEHLMNISHWDLSTTGTSSMRVNDEIAMASIWGGARVYSWINDLLSDKEKQDVRAMIKARCEDAMENKMLFENTHFEQYAFDSHNGRIWHMMGEAGIIFYHEIPEAKRWLDYALTIFYGWYPAWGDAEGGWSEGMHYFCSYNDFITMWLEEMKTILKIDPSKKPVYSAIGWQAYYCTPPGSSISLFGDFAENLPPVGRGRVLGYYASLANRGEWQWYANTVGSGDYQGWWDYLGAFRDKPEPIAPDFKTFHKVFKIAGFATIQSDYATSESNVQLSMRASPRGNRSHSHQDQGAIVLGAFGEPLLVNSGLRDVYGGPYCKEWYWNTLSHNALVFDNNEGQLRSPKAKATFVGDGGKNDEPFQWIAADMGPAYASKAKQAKRIVGFYNGDIIAVLTAMEPKPETKSATLVWHARMPFEFAQDGTFGLKGKLANLAAQTWCSWDAGMETTQTDKYSIAPDPHAKPKPEWHLWQKMQMPKQADIAMLKAMTVLMPTKAGADAVVKDVKTEWPSPDTAIVTWVKDGKNYKMMFDVNKNTVTCEEPK